MTSQKLSTFTMAACLIIMSTLLVGCQDTIPKSDFIDLGAQVTGGATGGGEEPLPVTRPTNAIKFKTDFCGCKDSVAITIGNNCPSVCAGKNTAGAETLFVNFTVNDEIALNTNFQNVNGWCNNIIDDDDTDANPKCVVTAKDEYNNVLEIAEVEPGSDGNKLKIALKDIPLDKVYVLTLVEKSSGAKSDSIQIKKFSPNTNISDLGPIGISPISQYTCIYREPSSVGNDVYYYSAFRAHYYFLPRFVPDPLPVTSPLICHDWSNGRRLDTALYPRLELIPGIFNLWDSSDPRFVDSNANQKLDVNEIIAQKANNYGAMNISSSTNFFVKFPVLTTAAANENAGSTISPAVSMGYYMSPFIDSVTRRSYCLNQTHYDSPNPLFQALRDVVGVPMEGIYVGVKAATTVEDADGDYVTSPADFLLIRETDLKETWFYLNNNVPTVPTEAIVKNVPVYFYYPLNKASPYIKTSTQQLYQVKGATELNNSTISGSDNSTSSGIPTSIEPHDRKIGCIPKF